MNRLAPILAFIVFLAAYHTAGALWGRDVKLYILFGMLGLYAVFTLVLFILRRRLRTEQPHLARALESEAGPSWYWKLLDGVVGLSFALGPPLIVSLVRRQPLSWESEVTGYHLIAMAGGVGVYLLGRAYVVRRWHRRHGVVNDAL